MSEKVGKGQSNKGLAKYLSSQSVYLGMLISPCMQSLLTNYILMLHAIHIVCVSHGPTTWVYSTDMDVNFSAEFVRPG